MKKRVLAVFFAVIAIVSLLSIFSFAEDGSDFTYCVISEEEKTAEITGYKGTATEIEIPSEIDGYTITVISSESFYDMTELTSIVIPDSVTSIRRDAFFGCTSLTNIKIPNTVKYIGQCAFRNCTSLTNIAIPDSVTELNPATFDGCTSLTNIEFSENNQYFSFEDGVLFDKDKTIIIEYLDSNIRTSYTIPNSVTTIGLDAFSNCTSLSSVNIPNSVTTIGRWAFSNCTSLTSVIISNSVTTIDSYTFYNCTSLTNITIPTSITTIGSSAFQNCSALTTVNYNGAKCQWDKIEIKSDNQKFVDATLIYNGAHSYAIYEIYTDKIVGETCKARGRCAVCDTIISIYEFVLGDTNGDGVVDGGDYDLMIQASACEIVLTPEQVLAADINGDGAVDTYDALCLDLLLNGWITNDDIMGIQTVAELPKKEEENE